MHFCGVFSWQFFSIFFIMNIYQTYFFSKTIFPHMMYLDKPYTHFYCDLECHYLSIYMHLHHYDLIVVLFKRMCTVPSMNLFFFVFWFSPSLCQSVIKKGRQMGTRLWHAWWILNPIALLPNKLIICCWCSVFLLQ